MARIALVGCSKQKLPHPAPARDLYTSPLFRAARRYAEARCDGWFVVSALHGVVAPDMVVAPYDVTMRDVRAGKHGGIEAWRKKVGDTIRRRFAGATLVVLAGAEYLCPLDSEFGTSVEAPMAGMQIGQRLAWLKAQIAPANPTAGGFRDWICLGCGGLKLSGDDPSGGECLDCGPGARYREACQAEVGQLNDDSVTGAASDPARELAKDLLDWDSQFGGPEDAECIIAGEDMARWVALARKVVGR